MEEPTDRAELRVWATHIVLVPPARALHIEMETDGCVWSTNRWAKIDWNSMARFRGKTRRFTRCLARGKEWDNLIVMRGRTEFRGMIDITSPSQRWEMHAQKLGVK